MEKAGDKLVLPIDNVVAKEFSNDAVATIVDSDSIPADQEGLDIGPKTVELFASYLKRCKNCCMEWTNGCIRITKLC